VFRRCELGALAFGARIAAGLVRVRASMCEAKIREVGQDNILSEALAIGWQESRWLLWEDFVLHVESSERVASVEY